jgi:hypothetical protein
MLCRLRRIVLSKILTGFRKQSFYAASPVLFPTAWYCWRILIGMRSGAYLHYFACTLPMAKIELHFVADILQLKVRECTILRLLAVFSR